VGFILDCSTTMSWCFKDEQNHYATAVLESLQHEQALVPALWNIEIANTLHVAFKKKRIDEAGELHFLGLLRSLPIKVAAANYKVQDLLLLSKEHQLTAYDVCYFLLAMMHQLPVATGDLELRRAVLKAGGTIYLE